MEIIKKIVATTAQVVELGNAAELTLGGNGKSYEFHRVNTYTGER